MVHSATLRATSCQIERPWAYVVGYPEHDLCMPCAFVDRRVMCDGGCGPEVWVGGRSLALGRACALKSQRSLFARVSLHVRAHICYMVRCELVLTPILRFWRRFRSF